MWTAKCLVLAVLFSSAIGGAYVLGMKAAPPPAPVEKVVPNLPAAAPPADITVKNPTGVLLGEVKMPDELLRPVPGPVLIVPEIRK